MLCNTTVDKINSCIYTLHMYDTFYHSEDSLGFMSVTAHRLLNSTLRRELKEAGIDMTPEQWGVLILLWERGNATQDELAQALCVDKSSMSRVLSLMEDKKMIIRRIDRANERKKVICAAEQSLAIRESGFMTANAVLQAALQGVDRQEAETCIKVLAAIKRNLRAKQP